nr:putative PIF1 DNA helicase/replication protein A1-like protein [Tanacetum cinerariifolium]
MHNPPKLLMDLISRNHPKSSNVIDNIRHYNSMFSFMSIGAKQYTSVNQGHGASCYRIQGQNCHRMDTLLQDKGKPPVFEKLYIYDTDNEIQHMIKYVSNDPSASTNNNEIDHDLTFELRDMLDTVNPLVAQFHMAGERLVTTTEENKEAMLCQQFIIGAYTMIERERMLYIKNQQKYLRSETYSKLKKLTEEKVAAFKLRGLDRVTTAVEDVEFDEIKEYYDCRYLSACDVAWRIYRFDIHYRFPPVERLPFHLKGEQSVIALTTKKGFGCQDKKVIGARYWVNFKTFDNIVYPTYKDACQARGLLEDDKEYIDGLLEASLWRLENYL